MFTVPGWLIGALVGWLLASVCVAAALGRWFRCLR